MVLPARLILLGYWVGPGTSHSWPAPEALVDEEWDSIERKLVADYLSRGVVARSYMGYSTCRICGLQNGDLELSDGTYVWPSGLAHYVDEHAVRLPERFVHHVIQRIESLESAERDEAWWHSQT